LDGLLFEISGQLSSMQATLSADSRTQVQADEIRSRLLLVDSLVAGIPTVSELRDENHYWAILNQQHGAYRKALELQATYLGDRIHFLDGQETEWQATWDQIRETAGIKSVGERVREELNRIRTTRQQVQKQLILVLAAQNVASQQGQQISEALSKLKKAQEQLWGRLLERDGYPLWEIRKLSNIKQPLITPIPQAIVREYRNVGTFMSANRLFIVAILLVYALALAAAFKLKHYVSTRTDMEISPSVLNTFSRPFSVALLLALLLTIGRLNRVTTGVACIFAWLWLLQAQRLLPPLIESRARVVLRMIVPFSMIETVRLLLPFSAVLKRELFVLNVLSVFVTLILLTRQWHVRGSPTTGRESWLFNVGIRVVIVSLGVAFASNFLGFRSLSQALGMGVFLGSIVAAALYGGVRVLTLLFTILLRTDWARSVLQTHARTIQDWGSRGLVFGTVLLWLRGMLQLFAIYDPLVGAISRVLQRRVEYGNVDFTLGGVLSVLSTMVIGYALANLFTLVLRQFVLPKFHLHRGVPYAISKVIYYCLLLLVVTTALADTGVELSKLTLLTGALGVGLGFGLQNIVNNFVSGLILLFERPVHVGDTVDVGGLVGRVRRIGARSSTVLTFQGAEVIVPNSNLISNQVINWTLSSAWRRVDIPVHVAYGTDPERVLKLLVEAANTHPRVLRERPSAAFFVGFGENALEFELRFWSAQHETWFDLRSEVTLAVAKALREAAIEVPFPQRDLHVRSITASVGESLNESGRIAPSAPSCENERLPAGRHK
jgi:small-conductance mechanosensitive channel